MWIHLKDTPILICEFNLTVYTIYILDYIDDTLVILLLIAILQYALGCSHSFLLHATIILVIYIIINIAEVIRSDLPLMYTSMTV